VSIDAHQHPASKLAAVADHLLTAFSGHTLQKRENKENRYLGVKWWILDNRCW